MMKKNILLLIVAMVLSANLFAQGFDKSKLRAGVGVVYATEIANVGINVNGAYSITDEWEGAVGFTHVFEKNYVTYNILDLDAHYIFYQEDEKFNVYGLAGLGFNSAKVNIPSTTIYGITVEGTDASSTSLGLNLGAGLNYKLSDKINLAPEIRYTIMDGSFLRIGASVQYLF